MADSKIPVEIEVRLDERSVGVSMESLKSRVKAQGREIGKAFGDAVRAGMGNFDFQGMPKGSSGSPSGYKPDPIDRTRSALERLLKTQELYDIKVKNGVITQRAYATGINNTIARMDQLGVASTRAYVPLTAFEKAPTIFGNMHDRLRKVALVTTEVTRAFFGLAAATAAAGAPAIVSTKYLSTIEDAKVGIAGTLQAISEAAGAGNKWNQSMIMSEGIINQLTDASVKYNISLDEISDTFRGLVGVGSAAGMSLQEVGRVATLGTMAVKSLNLNKTQTLQELRDLLQPGGIQAASSTLATALNITNAMTKKWKEAGTLFQELEKRITGYSMAAIERQNTLSGSFDILKIKIQRLFSDQGGFDVFKKIVKDISDSIGTINYETGKITFNKDLVESMKSYWTQIKAVASVLGTVAEITIKLTPTLVTLGQAFAAWFVAAKILPVIYTGLTAIGSAIAALPALFGSASAAMMTLGVTASAVGSKMGLMSAGAAGGLIGLALFGTYLLADHLGLIDQIFSTAENRAKSFRDKIKGYDVEQLQYRKMRIEGSIEYIEKERDTNPIPRRYDIDGTMMFTEAALKQLKSNLKATEYQIKQTVAANEKLADNARIQQGILSESESKDLESKRDPTVKRALAIESANRRLFDSLSGMGQAMQTNNLKEGSEEYAKAKKRQADAGRRYYAEIAEANRIGSEKRTKQTKDALKDALTAENIFAEKQDTLVREGAKTYIEAYNDKIAKIKEFAEKNGESIKWEERRNEAYKTVSDYLTQHNAQLNKESEQREANTTATLKYGAAVETSGAALLMEQYAREGFLTSGFKELALINVLAQSRNDLSKIHEKSVKEQIDSQKELDGLVAESSLIFLENEKQKSEFKMQETLKRINAEREEAKKSLELNLKLRMRAGPLSPQEYENYLETKEALDKSFMDREETTRKIFNQRVKDAELKDAKETVDKIEGTFKEAFMNIAENGVSGWRGMLDKFKSDFKKNIIEYIYKELAKPFVLNVIASVTGAMGMSGVSQAASRMARATGAGSSIYNAYSAGSSIMGAAGQGLYGTAYGQFATSGLGTALGLSHPASLMGPTVTGEALGGLTTLGTALPYATAALVIADAVGLFGEGGGPQQGQYGSLGAEGYKSSFTMSGGDALGNQALAEVAYGQAATLLKMAGKDIAGLTIGQGYKLDPEGSAAGLAYRNISLNGRTVTGGTFDGNTGAQWSGGSGDAAGAAGFLGKLTNEEIRKLVDAIGDSGLSETIEKLSANFTDLNDAIGKYTVAQAQQKALLSVVMTDDEKKTLQLADAQKVLDSTFASLGMSVPSTAAGFRDLINGLDLTTKAGQDALTKLSDVSGAYLTVANNAVDLANKAAEEAKAAQQEQYGWQVKLDIAQGKYTEQQAERFSIWHAAANDSTRAIISQVWALEDQKVALEAQKVATDAATESLKEMQDVAMEGVDNAFGELVSAYESEISAKESLIDKTKDYIRQLKDFSQSLALGELSTLDPLGKYQAAKSAFDAVSQRAMTGDSAAIEQLQGVSEAYLQASREYYASNVQYADDYNKVQSVISKTVNVAEQQVSSMNAQLITMRQQLSSLTQINESTKSVESAITRLQTALLEAVRVGNIGDVSEQAKTASGLIKGGVGELYNPLTDTWSNKGQSATTSQIRDWGAKILNEQGPMALYEATKSVGLSMSSVNVIAGWKAGTAEDWAKANNLPTFANGGFVKPGWAMVGERGPELVNFATQARVYTADQTSRMISGSGDNEVYLQQVIAELQALIRQNGASSQAMIAELQQVKAELEDLRSRTRLRDGTNG